ncbi:hypothetical protein E1I18_00715 [Mycoplasmopsis mucosicanis]|uniref:Lipoprotein n=1 Tax=Mycoplasmopsis mucosicanis TaxID=458208 RepID=A0A507SXW8_9BACT|nr:hypothetical protein [Mycoplasmopsis mucosicanis]TQC54112.1 hypothetical protein E1I18_00715 [Mycoplasmopsis mucosicanis]
MKVKNVLISLGFASITSLPIAAVSCANTKNQKQESGTDPLAPKKPQKPKTPELTETENDKIDKDIINTIEIAKKEIESSHNPKTINKLVKVIKLVYEITKINDFNLGLQLFDEASTIFYSVFPRSSADLLTEVPVEQQVKSLSNQLGNLNVNSDKNTIESFLKEVQKHQKLNEVFNEFGIKNIFYSNEILEDVVKKTNLLIELSEKSKENPQLLNARIQILDEISKLVTLRSIDLLFPKSEHKKIDKQTIQEKLNEKVNSIVEQTKKISPELKNKNQLEAIKKMLEDYKTEYIKSNMLFKKYGLGGNSYNEKSIDEAIKIVDQLIPLDNQGVNPNLAISLLGKIVRLLMPTKSDFIF